MDRFLLNEGFHILTNSFQVTILFLCPVKTAESFWFSDVFREYIIGTLARNGLTFEAPTPKNGQTNSNNLLAKAEKFFVSGYFVGLSLKGINYRLTRHLFACHFGHAFRSISVFQLFEFKGQHWIYGNSLENLRFLNYFQYCQSDSPVHLFIYLSIYLFCLYRSRRCC